MLRKRLQAKIVLWIALILAVFLGTSYYVTTNRTLKSLNEEFEEATRQQGDPADGRHLQQHRLHHRERPHAPAAPDGRADQLLHRAEAAGDLLAGRHHPPVAQPRGRRQEDLGGALRRLREQRGQGQGLRRRQRPPVLHGQAAVQPGALPRLPRQEQARARHPRRLPEHEQRPAAHGQEPGHHAHRGDHGRGGDDPRHLARADAAAGAARQPAGLAHAQGDPRGREREHERARRVHLAATSSG